MKDCFIETSNNAVHTPVGKTSNITAKEVAKQGTIFVCDVHQHQK